MEFRKYQHIERYGTVETEGINNGICYIFPKIDGTNTSVWLSDNGEVCVGSRKRELNAENDNRNSYKTISDNDNIKNYLKQHPTHRLYGEWLVPHTIRTYEDTAWNNFYIFDVVEEVSDSTRYLPYEEYVPLLEEHDIKYIPLLNKIFDGEYEDFVKELDNNTFLIKVDNGVGEGIVIKNYEYTNK